MWTNSPETTYNMGQTSDFFRPVFRNLVMRHTRLLIAICVTLAIGTLFWLTAAAAQRDDRPTLQAAMQLHNDGNFKDAYNALRKLALDENMPSTDLSTVVGTAISCLQQLNLVDEIDEFREAAVAAHADDWRLLMAIAQSYLDVDHYGFMIGGDFHRGQHRGGGRVVHATDRDRVRALQLFFRGMRQAEKDDGKVDQSQLVKQFADAILFDSDSRQAWRLQSLTDLETLPDYEEGWGHYGSAPQGAPVDANGNPIFYSVPESWEGAKSDGQRWRWLLETMVEWHPKRRNEERQMRAQFLHRQFGVQTMAEYHILFAESRDNGRKNGETGSATGAWALDTLGDEETIARLATGIKRFKLPDEHNFIKLYQQVFEEPAADDEGDRRLFAIRSLAEIFQDRRQYPRAAEYWRMAIERLKADEEARAHYQHRLDQVVGNWGQFESVMSQPAGRGATVDFRFRNAKHVQFVAHQIDIPKLLDDVKAYLKSNPRQLEWERMNVSEIGYRLVQENQKQYLGSQVAKWELELEPREKHFDRRITVTTPLQKAGAYLLTAKVEGGNTSKIVVWLSDTAIVRKPMPDKSFYFVADALTGAPIAKANVEFFAYRQRHIDGNNYQVDTKQFAELTNANGQALLPLPNDENDPSQREFQWIATATTPDGRLAYLGFHNVWRAEYHDAQYNETKTFAITDRPVYRPSQTVEFKFWIRQAKYDLDDKSQFAHESFAVEIHNPKGEKVYGETLTADNYGGIAGKFELPADATLGQYQLMVVNRGGSTFRVEEYKKPEFEVTVEAPTEPVMLGEKITATIRAKYYFGSPVTSATVKYKVLRSEHTARWFPPGPWDWLYGPGYWWFAYDYDWYPGWRDWGCARPAPWWYWQPSAPPEIVAEREVSIGSDGTVSVEIDTSLAKAAHPDQDHRYSILAEVVDQSRRTIVGSGEVLVARKPFQVYAWVDRGYYRVGDTIAASFAARRLDGKPVEGAGKLRLLKIAYGEVGPSSRGGPDAGNNETRGAARLAAPTETEVRSWDLVTNAEGRAEIQIKASDKGQYRLSYRVTDKAAHEIEGGYLFTITGEGFDGSEFRFSDLELLPDKREYQPEEKVSLQVNTNRVGSTVLLFVRPANGAYLAPQMLRPRGKSSVIDVGVSQKDLPNFFVEAVTIANGRVHTEAREIHVPPVKRIINVEVVPSADAYQPGQHANLKLKLTDEAGKPFVGSTVLSIFDKSLVYISGGTNVEDIKAFFWKWRRQHRPYLETNLDRWFANLVPPGEKGLESLGVFGDTVADEIETRSLTATGGGFGGLGRRRSDRYSLGAEVAGAAPAAAAQVKEMADFAGEPNVDLFSAGVPADGRAEPPLIEPTVRSEFADTALWVASIESDKNGLAEVELDMPENLTAWKIQAWSMGHGTRVGQASAEVVTRKNLIVRMQAPRFFVERDEVVLSANVHNYLPAAKQVKVRLELNGNTLELPTANEELVEIPPGGERRVDWRVKVAREGEAALRMLALTDEESDAVEMKFPVHVHGMLKTDSFSGALRPEQQLGAFEITVPRERRADQTRLEVRYSPTLAGAMVDALPYLIDYPYGCTEQTLNRFLPAVITQQTLLRMQLDLKAIREKRSNLNAQEIGDAADRAKGWQRYKANPVFDEAELTKIVKAGVNRLTEMQLSDGGWGWFSGWGERSTPHMTAIVVHGLTIARENDVALVPGVLERGIEWLKNYQEEQLRYLANVDDDGNVIDKNKPAKHDADNLDALVYMVLVDAGVTSNSMRDHLYNDRTKLAVYGLATYGLALHKQNEADKLAMIMRNISQYLVQDNENQTAYLNIPEGIWWYWYGSEFEAHAYYLKLLAAVEPNSEVAPRLVKYLINNRKHATYWNSTRDTSLAIEALADYLKASGEDKPDMAVELWVDGQKRKEVKINGENLFTFDNTYVLAGEALEPGPHTIELRKTGTGPLYWNGYLTNFTLEDEIRRAGLELKVDRSYYKLTPVDKSIQVSGGQGQVVDQQVEKYNRTEIDNLDSVASGDLLEIELVVESKNDYEYILFEDMKAAGCEPVSLQSGYNGNELGAYMELRDNRVALFVQRLARGRHSVSYRMRAETPGRFSALPTKAAAMYAPELRANSDELKLQIQDRELAAELVPPESAASIRGDIQ
jgi:alpha-2-macroglobulin